MNSHEGAPGLSTPFCIPGGHPVDPATSWRLVPMSSTGRDGGWYPNPDSAARVVVCQFHETTETTETTDLPA
jgi:hypothetical protein